MGKVGAEGMRRRWSYRHEFPGSLDEQAHVVKILSILLCLALYRDRCIRLLCQIPIISHKSYHRDL